MSTKVLQLAFKIKYIVQLKQWKNGLVFGAVRLNIIDPILFAVFTHTIV